MQQIRLLIITLLILTIGSVSLIAQSNIDAMTIDALNVRTGPDTSYTAISQVAARSDVIVVARNNTGSWVLIQTPDNSLRGWVATRYVVWDQDIELGEIAISTELLAAPVAPVTDNPQTNQPPEEPAAPVNIDGLTGTPIATLNVRTGPGVRNTALTTVSPSTQVTIAGRNDIGDWLLIATDNLRGWVATRYMLWDETVELSDIPITSETITASSAPSAPLTAGSIPPTSGAGQLPSVTDDGAVVSEYEAGLMNIMRSIPVLPNISGTARAIYQRGIQMGNNPRNFSHVGDSNSASGAYLWLVGMGAYNLGQYGYLQNVISHYGTPDGSGANNSFTAPSMTTNSGFLTTSLLDPAFANPRYCQPGENLLQCEDRLNNPSVVVIYLGVADKTFLTRDQYDGAMRHIVQFWVDRGVLPVLTMMPARPGQVEALEFNMTIIDIARGYDIPLINMWAAVHELPGYGVQDDHIHFTYSGSDFMDFGGDQNTWGYTNWNLTVLQTLDLVRKAVG